MFGPASCWLYQEMLRVAENLGDGKPEEVVGVLAFSLKGRIPEPAPGGTKGRAARGGRL